MGFLVEAREVHEGTLGAPLVISSLCPEPPPPPAFKGTRESYQRMATEPFILAVCLRPEQGDTVLKAYEIPRGSPVVVVGGEWRISVLQDRALANRPWALFDSERIDSDVPFIYVPISEHTIIPMGFLRFQRSRLGCDWYVCCDPGDRISSISYRSGNRQVTLHCRERVSHLLGDLVEIHVNNNGHGADILLSTFF